MINQIDSFLGKRKISMMLFHVVHTSGGILALAGLASEAWFGASADVRDILLLTGVGIIVIPWLLRFSYHVIGMTVLPLSIWHVTASSGHPLAWLILAIAVCVGVFSFWRGAHWDKIYGDDKTFGRCPIGWPVTDP